MSNTWMIDKVTDIVNNYFEAKNICEETKTIRARALDWYYHYPFDDPYLIATAVIDGGNGDLWKYSISLNELLNKKQYYFGEV